MYRIHRSRHACLAFTLLTIGMVGCSRAPSDTPAQSAQVPSSDAADAQEQQHLATFDDLDFNVYSGQKWDEFPRSHSADIVVHYPDGHTTTGLEAHLVELKPQFVFAPDTRIKTHPIKIAQGNFTAVMGVMEGTFSQPMPIGGGKTIAPTNKTFSLQMTTIGRWENGVMVEE